MAIYTIPIVYQKIVYMTVESESLQGAVEQGLKDFFNIPDEGYLEDSFEVDSIIEDEYPDESYDYEQALSKI